MTIAALRLNIEEEHLVVICGCAKFRTIRSPVNSINSPATPFVFSVQRVLVGLWVNAIDVDICVVGP